MPLDNTGFSVPSYPQLLDQMTTKAKQLFGDDVQTDANSVLGMWIRTICWLQVTMYQDVQDTYLSNFIDQASGTSLDQLGNNYSVARSPATAATVSLQFTGTPGYTIASDQDGSLFGTAEDVEFQLLDDVTLDDKGNGSGDAQAVDTGPSGNVAANTITVQIEQSDQVASVTNPEPAGGGTDLETDDSYRQRIHLSMEAQPGPTLMGLYTALYARPGVQQVQIVPNLTMDTDSYGNPPKSLHFYIQGGAQQDLGQAILDNIAAGIQTVGKIKVTAKDISEHTHDVFFDAATVVPIYVTMTIKTNDEFNPADGPAAILAAIKDYLSSLIMGDQIVFTKLYQAIYNVTGVDYVSVTMGRDKAKMGTDDIQLDQFETPAIANDSDVEVKIDE